MGMGSKKIIFIVLIVILISFACGSVVEANAAEPPSILIIVPNAPDDLQITINDVEASRRDKLFEKYYLFYARDLHSDSVYILEVSTDGRTFELSLVRPSYIYENVFTLDLNNKVLTPGKNQSRSIALIILRVLITLMVEGCVFYLFGFRQRRSWVIFLIVNLITQGLLNLWISGLFPMSGYIFSALLFFEVLVVIVEILAFLLLVKEQSRLRIIEFVVAANILSLLIGMILITSLPI
jgi:hypothetical protein